uniref:virulence factor n=1 Tax=Massilia luteola TaxID=3081751 RepID=UPI002ACBFDE0
MRIFAGFTLRQFAYSILAFIIAVAISIWMTARSGTDAAQSLTDGQLLTRLVAIPTAFATLTFGVMLGIAARPVHAEAEAAAKPAPAPARPYMAQVVGLQWLNPLERMDYPTEWQLLWTLGLVKPNPDDDMVRTEPQTFTKLQAIAAIANPAGGRDSFDAFHKKYVDKLMYLYRDIYFMDSNYFYNAHNVEDKSTWRELAGIHVEYALPAGKLDPVSAANRTRDVIIEAFDIGLPGAPGSWTRSTPPDVRVTPGGANAGFTSLSAALDYLQAHPKETVWVMNWDAPSYPPKDEQINENMVLLILAGPEFKTERAPLAWLGYPASAKIADFDSGKDKPPRVIQAWKAAVEKAAHNAGKQTTDVGYVIHDANNAASNNAATASDRIAALARTVTEEMPELDFMKQAFNTPALLGEMGAGTALTNVALGIAYANHLGKNVLVAGTTDEAQPVATLVVPPAVV